MLRWQQQYMNRKIFNWAIQSELGYEDKGKKYPKRKSKKKILSKKRKIDIQDISTGEL